MPVGEEAGQPRRHYTALTRQVGRFWQVEIAELGRSTQAPHLDHVERMARDLISAAEDVPGQSFDISVVRTDPPPEHGSEP